jgi:hypothetical protein
LRLLAAPSLQLFSFGERSVRDVAGYQNRLQTHFLRPVNSIEKWKRKIFGRVIQVGSS